MPPDETEVSQDGAVAAPESSQPATEAAPEPQPEGDDGAAVEEPTVESLQAKLDAAEKRAADLEKQSRADKSAHDRDVAAARRELRDIKLRQAAATEAQKDAEKRRLAEEEGGELGKMTLEELEAKQRTQGTSTAVRRAVEQEQQRIANEVWESTRSHDMFSELSEDEITAAVSRAQEKYVGVTNPDGSPRQPSYGDVVGEMTHTVVEKAKGGTVSTEEREEQEAQARESVGAAARSSSGPAAPSGVRGAGQSDDAFLDSYSKGESDDHARAKKILESRGLSFD